MSAPREIASFVLFPTGADVKCIILHGLLPRELKRISHYNFSKKACRSTSIRLLFYKTINLWFSCLDA